MKKIPTKEEVLKYSHTRKGDVVNQRFFGTITYIDGEYAICYIEDYTNSSNSMERYSLAISNFSEEDRKIIAPEQEYVALYNDKRNIWDLYIVNSKKKKHPYQPFKR
jgi:hypothetical protein